MTIKSKTAIVLLALICIMGTPLFTVAQDSKGDFEQNYIDLLQSQASLHEPDHQDAQRAQGDDDHAPNAGAHHRDEQRVGDGLPHRHQQQLLL